MQEAAAGGGCCSAVALPPPLPSPLPLARGPGRGGPGGDLAARSVRPRERPRTARAMSNVRISSGSPTLERMEGRQADCPKPSACRSLFGPVDHGELARELQKHSRELEAAGRRRWNFDFPRGRPLRGRYEWHAVSKDALPEFYSRPPRPGPAAGQKRRLDGHGSPGWRRRSQGLAGDPDGGEDAALGAARKTEAAPADLAGQPNPGAQRKRPAPDDSFPPNKRANMTEEAISEGSPSASSVEQTPKKSSPRQCQT